MRLFSPCPTPDNTGPFTTPVLRPLNALGNSKAGWALNRARPSAPALTTKGTLSHNTTDISTAMPGRGLILKAGNWWLVMAQDRTGIFVHAHPKTVQYCTVAPLAVQLQSRLTLGGETHTLTLNDLSDPLENPDFSTAFAQHLHTAIAEQLEAWGAACDQAPKLSETWPPAPGTLPRWFSELRTATLADTTDLVAFCTGVALLANPGRSDPPVIRIEGAVLRADGTVRPARVVDASGTADPAVITQANAVLRSADFFWPPERQIAQCYSTQRRRTFGPSVVATNRPITGSAHEKIAHAHAARTYVRAIFDKLVEPGPKALHSCA